MEIKPTYVTFSQAKWLKEKGFDVECTRFDVKPNSKIFGIDEHGRYYPIKNKPKELWIVGSCVAQNITNVLLAPEQWQVVEWLLINHGVWIKVSVEEWFKEDTKRNFSWHITAGKYTEIDGVIYNTPQEAYSAAFDYIFNNNLI
jgi:hypothetical protein